MQNFVNLMYFTTHLAPNIMIGSTVASSVILNPNIFSLIKVFDRKKYICQYRHICNSYHAIFYMGPSLNSNSDLSYLYLYV